MSPPVAPGDIRAALPASPPTTGESWDEIFADLDRVIVPGLTHWQAPGFFGFFPANSSGPAVLGELASAGLGVQGMAWSTSPACTELEQHVLDWLIDLCGLPEQFRSSGPGGGVIQDSASSATLCALLAARHRRGGPGEVRDATVYCTSETHSSLTKDTRIAGLNDDQLRTLPTRDRAMDPAALDEALATDIAAGHRPLMVIATVGTTATGAHDPVAAVAPIARRAGAWLHVDAAWAGSAAVCPEFRGPLEGLDGADSYVFNPHKWLLTNFDCSCFYVRDREPLLGALSILPEYLRTAAGQAGTVADLRDWQIPLGRRFRALKLWMVIRHYGAEGLRAHIRGHVAAAEALEARLAAIPGVVLAVPRSLALVCLRSTAGDAATDSLLAHLNGTGRFFVSHASADGHRIIRVAVGGTRTRAEHVLDLADEIEEWSRGG